MRKWIDKKLLNLMCHYVLYQKSILSEMIITPKTTYRYACLNLAFEVNDFKIEILKTLLSKQYSKLLDSEIKYKNRR